MKPNGGASRKGAFTLLELLLVIAIIALLVSLLLPSLQRGQVKVRSLQCKNNLHQLGLGMLSFAHAHDDKFPVQVSTNQGGSSEFIDAGNAINGEFYFAYKHFLPLTAELQSPKLLVCPSDSRKAATNFNALRNTNLSYFVAADPQSGNPESILSGDRNLSVVSNSIARLRGRPLKWNGELHEYKGNVVFGDGHVELLGNVPVQTALAGRSVPSLVLPSAPPPPVVLPPAVGSGGGVGGLGSPIQGGNLTANFSAGTNLGGVTNGVLTNRTIISGPPRLPPWPFTGPGPDGGLQPISMPTLGTQQTVAGTAPAAAAPEVTAEEEVQDAHDNLVDKGMDLARKGARTAYLIPWWLIVGLLLGCVWLLHRVHSRAPSASAKPARSFGVGREA